MILKCSYDGYSEDLDGTLKLENNEDNIPILMISYEKEYRNICDTWFSQHALYISCKEIYNSHSFTSMEYDIN